MKKTNSLLIICIILICQAFLPQGKTLAANTGGSVMIATDAVNIRSGPDLTYPLIAIAKRGETYQVVQEQGDWVEVRLSVSKTGWLVNWLVTTESEKTQATATGSQGSQTSQATDNGIVTADTLNIRMEPSTASTVVGKLAMGSMVRIYSRQKNWLEVGFAGLRGWVNAEFINRSASLDMKTSPAHPLKNKTIVIDPGHGGRDKGTTGASGTLEKDLTYRTAWLLYDKLNSAGANVYLTRYSDSYLSLSERVRIGQTYHADAFISLHYDSSLDPNIQGMTSYYYHAYQKALATSLYNAVRGKTKLLSRGVRFGDFHVIRENSQNAVLIELGYLSNPEEESVLNSSSYQEDAAVGLYNGLVRYFKKNH